MMVAMNHRLSPVVRRNLRAFVVTAILTALISGAVTAGVITAEGVLFTLIGRRSARQNRGAAV